MELKKLTLDDVEALKAISTETFVDTFGPYNTKEDLEIYTDQAYSIEQLSVELQRSDSDFYFVMVNDDIAGYIKINENNAQTEDMGHDALEIERIYIRTKYHRQGLGKKLYEKALELAREKGKKSIWLGVWENNDQAIAFYNSIGFKHIGEHAFYLGNDRQIDWLMLKEI